MGHNPGKPLVGKTAPSYFAATGLSLLRNRNRVNRTLPPEPKARSLGKVRTENSSNTRTVTVTVAGSEPVVLHLDSTGAATLRLEVTVTPPNVTGYTFTEPPR